MAPKGTSTQPIHSQAQAQLTPKRPRNTYAHTAFSTSRALGQGSGLGPTDSSALGSTAAELMRSKVGCFDSLLVPPRQSRNIAGRWDADKGGRGDRPLAGCAGSAREPAAGSSLGPWSLENGEFGQRTTGLRRIWAS
ncbi:hypothetical protein S40293_10985 [Stachybotrys chartarum IBT 40293]|nr:hypothetical protein S40293_10985 [Stachybotrys chartarum IBT 40293]